ncbi:aKG-HExxH-type peptide beta-hydroxylase [Streptomyces hesseae]|uniref:HEXXH motif-containing putative peptide modification protein n=1 Tax=Streptomyces hesseae TaxID=3075519 RepID=A0ABU2T0P4_9ACTN|nr:HEXXH motif-containing putative peptide modification protein [Streptomyces sp. DSM 40473]MDT0453764.1 HEXXH motif-containing putative peptide modification protein [Streptomyces sp. DSM 40473]
MDLSALFRLPATEQLHHRKALHIHTTLGASTPALPAAHPAARYALAHHALEGAERAARDEDADTFRWYAQHLDVNAASLTEEPCMFPVVLAPPPNQVQESPTSHAPTYVIGPSTTPAPDRLRQMTRVAYDHAAESGFGALLSAHAVVVCLLSHRPLTGILRSWTTSRLPGTVFIDYTDHPAVLARDLIHESGHNWLNDALAATGIELNGEEEFFSPWKNTLRPAFGFLHACWAFPLMMIYAARVLDNARTAPEIRRFLAAYLDYQRARLTTTGESHARALNLVTDAELRHRLRSAHQEASAL